MGTAFALTRNTADAEDLVQSAFERAVQHHQLLPANTNWRAWLRTVMRHLTIDLARHNQARRIHEGYDLERLPALEHEPSARWSEIGAEQLEHAIAACDRAFREVYELHCREGLSYAEIGKRMNLPIGTVATRVYRARARIRSQLEALPEARQLRASAQLAFDASPQRPLALRMRRVEPDAWSVHAMRRAMLRGRFTLRDLREQSAPTPFKLRQLSSLQQQFEEGTTMKIKKIEAAKETTHKDVKDAAGVQVKTAIKAGAAKLVAVCG
jgi:RNA polymerase sigma-70 factor (ECF subfamily)